MKNKIILFIISFLLLLPIDTFGLESDIPKVDESKKVYDFANLFSSEEEEKIFENATKFISTYDMDIVVVTIEENNEESAKSYAEDFYDYNNFGTNETKDGLLLLIDMDNRELYIVTTGRGQLFFDDERLEDILDSIYYYASVGEYGSGALNFIKESSHFASLGIPESNSDYYISSDGELLKRKSVNYVISILVAIVVASITTYVFMSKHKKIKLATEASNYLEEDKIKFKATSDRFLTTFTTRVPIVHDSYNGGGGAGSTTSRGSSGTYHGGAGRHF